MNYDYLKNETAPQVLIQARKLIGTKEIIGSIHNKTIMSWAKELGLQNIYTSDEVPWCALYIAFVCHKAGLEINMTNEQALWALNWSKFGTKQTVAMLGDILTFKREGGGHVAIYVGEDESCYHVIGGNQGNQVSITRIEKIRCKSIRRTDWKVAQPENVRQIHVNSNGFISQNEA